MFLAENLKALLSASIAFDWSNALEPSPNPYTSRKEQEYKDENLIFLLLFFFC